MKFTTDPMMIGGYGIWEIDDKPVTNKAGEPVEYIQLIDLDADEVHRFTLRDVPDAERPEPMTFATCQCQARLAAKGREDGSVSTRLKVQVVGLKKAQPPRPPASANA